MNKFHLAIDIGASSGCHIIGWKEIGEYKGMKCVLCATHDTASAVEGIPMEGNAPYIFFGTWSLLGVKTPRPITDAASMAANYSNEGGVGYNRYQKNIMGMRLVNELRRDLCPDIPFCEIVAAAEQSTCDVVVDANAPMFLAPESMKAAFDEATGGAQNQFLNRLTVEATGKQVIALPIEATALGNLKIQSGSISARSAAWAAISPLPSSPMRSAIRSPCPAPTRKPASSGLNMDGLASASASI